MSFGGAVKFGKAVIDMGFDATLAQRQMRQFRRQLSDVGRIGGAAFSAIAAGLTPITIMLGKATQAAVRFQEVTSRFEITFRDAGSAANRFAEGLVKNLGQSRGAIQSTLSGFAGQFTGLGGTSQEAFKLSRILTQASIDLGSFFDVAQPDVFRDLQSAIAGSGEVMRRYAISVNEALVKQELLNQRIDPKNATEYQKAIARVRLIMRGLSDAHGDAARTAGSVANRWRRLQNQWENQMVELGDKLLPGVADALEGVIKLTDRWKNEITGIGDAAADALRAINPKEKSNVFGAFNPFSGNAATDARFMLAMREQFGFSIPLNMRHLIDGTAFASTRQLQRVVATNESRRMPRQRSAAIPETPPVQLPELDQQGGGASNLQRRILQNRVIGQARATLNQSRRFANQLPGFLGRGIGGVAAQLVQGRAPQVSDFSSVSFARDFAGANTTARREDIERQQLKVLTELFEWIQREGVVFQ